MKRVLFTLLAATGMVAAIEAAPTDPVTQADLQTVIERLNKLEAENKAQAARIGELELENRSLKAGVQPKAEAGKAAVAVEEGASVDETGRIYTAKNGRSYYLADKVAGIFEPLTENGLTFSPYAWLVLEGVHNTHKTAADIYTDYVYPRHNGMHNGDHQTTLSMNDSILGFTVDTPQAIQGWKYGAKFEFDLAGDDANHPDFHLRHLYFQMEHDSGWQLTFGQTWHLWKMVTPNEIDGAWLENTGYPYRRSPQLRVTKTFKELAGGELELRAGIVKNGNGMGGDRDSDNNQDTSASAWALVEGAAIYTHTAFWDEKNEWLLGLAGQYGRDKSRRVDEEGNLGQSDEYNSQLVMVAGELPVFSGLFNHGDDNRDSLRVVGQLFAGENLGGVQAGVGQKVAFRDPTRKGREISTVGGFIDIRYDWDAKWACAVGYGFDDPVDSEAHYANGPDGAEGITYNDRLYADIFYQFRPNMRFAVEYAHLKTKYFEEGSANDDRFQFTIGYDF